MEADLTQLLGAVIAIASVLLGLFYWNDRRNERRIDRLEARQNQQFRELKARQKKK